MKSHVRKLIETIKASVFGTEISFKVSHDDEFENGRVYVQPYYVDECRVTGEEQEWKGRKWYLSRHMTEDEVVKTCYAAFKACVEHEIMEGFSYNDEVVFNPHAPFQKCIEAGREEVSRENGNKIGSFLADTNFIV